MLSSFSLPSSQPSSEGIRYSYLLFRKNGSFLPLIAIDDLPSAMPVLPPLDGAIGITLVQEILRPPPDAGLPAGTGKTNAPDTTETETAGSSVFQHHGSSGSTTSSSSSSFSSVPTVTDYILDTVRPDIPCPKLFASKSEDPTFALSPIAQNGMLYVPPHSKGPTVLALVTECAVPTRDLLLHAFKSRQGYLSPGTCLWGTSSSYDSPILSSGRLVSSNDDNSSAGGESAASLTETLPSSVEEDSAGDGSETLIGNGKTSRGEEKKHQSTELCAYFHRKVGCKRGKNCFYVHEEDGRTSLAGVQYIPVKEPILIPNNNNNNSTTRRLESKWRRLDPQPASSPEKGNRKIQQVAEEVVVDEKVGIPKVTCPAPGGHTLSDMDPAARRIKTHCTFFLRFGECDYWPECKFSHDCLEGTSSRWCGSKLLSSLKGAAVKSVGAEVQSIFSGRDLQGCSGELERIAIGADARRRRRMAIAEEQLISLTE